MSARSSASRRHDITQRGRQCLAYLIDVAAFALAAFIACKLRFDGALPPHLIHPMYALICVSVASKSLAFMLASVRWGHWRYTSVSDALRIMIANSLGALLAFAAGMVLPELSAIPRSIHIFDWMVSCQMTLGSRLALRLIVSARDGDRAVDRPEGKRIRTLVYGAGAAGLALVQELQQNKALMCNVIGLIDDDPDKADLLLKGKRVLGPGETLVTWVQRKKIKKILIAIPSATGPQLVRILRLAADAKVQYKMVPGLGELIQDADPDTQIRDVAVKDVLAKKPVQVDLERIRERIQGRVVLGPGDELVIRAWGKIDLDARVTVDRNGQIFLSKVGVVTVAGLRFEQAEGYLHAAISALYKDFDLNVALGKLPSIQVFVLGSARRPGVYTVSSLSTLMNALFACGGPSSTGSMRRIQLRRNGRLLSEFDLYDLAQKGDQSHDVPLLPGDVIFIPPIGPQAAISGSVNQPGIYELRGETTVAAALAGAGGLTSLAGSVHVQLERIDDRSTHRVDEFSLDAAGLQRTLKDGDLLRIFPISPKFDNAVNLHGNVAEPSRYV